MGTLALQQNSSLLDLEVGKFSYLMSRILKIERSRHTARQGFFKTNLGAHYFQLGVKQDREVGGSGEDRQVRT